MTDRMPFDDLLPSRRQLLQLATQTEHGHVMLLGVTGHARGVRWLLDTTAQVVGRDETADLYLDDPTIDRRHAQLTRMGATWVVRDLGSVAGTWVNGHLIESARLGTGDRVRFGAYVFVCVRGQRHAPSLAAAA